jgi:glucosamine-6-phosphate isomerase
VEQVRRPSSRISAHASIVVLRDQDEVGRLAAALIVNRLSARPLRLLLPTGHTPLPMYDALRVAARDGRIPSQGAEVLQLDEYLGVSTAFSYRSYLERELAGSGLRLTEAFDRSAPDLSAEVARYQAVLDAGEIDLAVLGIGPDGHVAFNEPGSDPLSGARVVPLTASTRQAAAHDFGSLDDVPTHALTVGMRTLLEAREVILLVTGPVKAEILREALTGQPRSSVPASLLRLHPRLTVLCDRAAAARLPDVSGWNSDHALVVLGHRDPTSRKHRASHQSFARLRIAKRVARGTPVRAVVITGFTSAGGQSEAEQMAAEWSSDDAPVLLEVAGRDTIENATRSLPLVSALGGIRRVTVVTSAWHLRARRAFAPYRRHGLQVRFRYDWSEGPWLKMLMNELRLMRAARKQRPHRKARFAAFAAVAVSLLALAAVAVVLLGRSGLQPCTIGGHRAQCMLFAVAENPGDPGGKKLHLRVAVFKATGPNRRPDPFMWFSGWGGAGVTDDAAAVMSALRRVNIERDLVFIDQRGTGGSKLVCGLPRAWDSARAPAAMLTAAARRCADRIGPNLRFYTSAVAVDDFDRVRAALGYDKVNIYGGSYGVTTGQIYLLRHGAHVRSAAFDSGSLLDVRIFENAARGEQRSLDLLFRDCAADTSCSTAYPNLRQEFKALMARLARHPVEVPGTGRLTPVTFAVAVSDLLAYSPNKALAPRLIHLIAKGRIGEATEGFPHESSPPTSELAYKLLIQCSEPWASWREAEVRRLGAGSFLQPFELRYARVMAAVCRGLPRAPVPANIGERVHSNVPVLFMNGDQDGADPPANVAHARRELPNSRTVIFPRAGHGQLGTLCAQNLIADFVEAGSANGLDVSCAATAIQRTFDVRP